MDVAVPAPVSAVGHCPLVVFRAVMAAADMAFLLPSLAHFVVTGFTAKAEIPSRGNTQ